LQLNDEHANVPSVRFPFLLALTSALLHPLAAQDAPWRARSATLEWLGDRMDRRDDIISPARYGGLVWGARAAYGGDWTAHRTTVSAEFRTGALSGAIGNGSSETVYDGKLAGSYLRRTRAGFVGAELSARASLVAHNYGQSGFSDDYGLLLVSVSPAIDWDRRGWRLRASAPLLSLVSRPYSRLNITRVHLPLRVAGPDQVRAAHVTVAYTAATKRRAALLTSYALDLLSIADQPGLASVENRFTVGVRWRLGRSR